MDVKQIFESVIKQKCLFVNQLNGGVTNLSYLVETSAGRYIIRIPGKGTNEYINRNWEIENMKRVFALGFAPEIIYADAATGIIVSQYIENNISMCKTDIYNDGRLRLMNESLVRLHRAPMELSNEFDITGNRKKYERILEKMEVKLPDELLDNVPKLLKASDDLFLKYKKELVPCHGDPKLNNFLLQGDKMWLIDWEYSGMAEKYFDLVNWTMTNRLNNTEEEIVLQSYELCSGEKLDREKYLLYKAATDYLWIYWHLIKFFQDEMTEYNDASWRFRLHRALETIDQLYG